MGGSSSIGGALPLASVLALDAADPDAARIEALRRAPAAGARQAAAKELQTIFLTQLLRAMRKTVPESDFLPRSPARDVYEGMFDRSVAEAVAARDPLGMVRALGESPPGLKIRERPADKVVGQQKAGQP
jgi:Rod binding domain-containing protein